jgi:hypothetical protein
MSLSIPSPLQPLERVLRRIPAAVLLWRLLRKTAVAARYYVLRLIGYAAYPILGRRAPLRGYHVRTQDFMRRGVGDYISLQPPSLVNNTKPSDPFQPERFVAVVPGGRVLYESGVVITPDHRLLADVSWHGHDLISQPKYHPAMHKLSLPPVKYVAGRLAVISSVMPYNYYHWMVDILPRLRTLQSSGLVPDYYFINATTQFQKDSLKALNITTDRILCPTGDTHIEADELIIPSLPGPAFEMTPQLEACEYLRSTFLQKDRTRKPHRAIYITRNDAKIRRVINEAEIREEVIDNGFEIVSLSDVPVLEQIEMFAEARIVVGPHGAGFTNAIFCQPGSVLIEFLAEGWQIVSIQRLARLCGMTYHSIVCKESGISNGQPASHDHTVDRVELRKLLRQYS